MKKRCSTCGEEKDLEHCFWRVRKGSEERQSRCKVCDGAARAKNMRGESGYDSRGYTPSSRALRDIEAMRKRLGR
jgi:hypothetical protein